MLLMTTVYSQSKVYLKKDINVLFIGNSLTYFHNMPTILQDIFIENNKNIRVFQSTFPGIPLHNHHNKYTFVNKEG